MLIVLENLFDQLIYYYWPHHQALGIVEVRKKKIVK
jgi:hypothetical protein